MVPQLVASFTRYALATQCRDPMPSAAVYQLSIEWLAVGSKKLAHGCEMISVGFPSFFGVGLEDGHVATFQPLPNGIASSI